MSSLNHARVVNDVFFTNDYLTIGINAGGALGTASARPFGFAGNFSNVGMFGGGVVPSASDSVLPGTPVDGFTVAHDGLNYTNDQLQGDADIVLVANSIKDQSTATQAKAKWSGLTADGMRVDQTITMNPSDQYITVKVTLKNTTGVAMNGVRYLRNVDPDHGISVTGYPTNNVVFAQTAKAHGVAAYIPTDAGATGSAPVFFYSKDTRAEVSATPGLIHDDAYDASLSGQAQGTTHLNTDEGINLLFTVGTLAAGASTTLTYYYGITDSLDLTIPKLGSKPIDLTSGDDTVSYAGGPKVFVDGGAGADTITGSSDNDIIQGGLNADDLRGGAGKDILDGGQGADFITGGAGADIMTGGYGQDKFIFLSISDSTVATSGRDTITDFSHSENDRIDLTAIDANTNTGANDSFVLVGAFTGVAGQLTQVATTGGYLVQGDVNGNGTADFSIFVKHASLLVAADFNL